MIDTKVLNIWLGLALVFTSYALMSMSTHSVQKDTGLSWGRGGWKGALTPTFFTVMWAIVMALYGYGVQAVLKDLRNDDNQRDYDLVTMCFNLSLILILCWGICYHSRCANRKVAGSSDVMLDKLLDMRIVCAVISLASVALYTIIISKTKKKFGFVIPILVWQIIGTSFTFTSPPPHAQRGSVA